MLADQPDSGISELEKLAAGHIPRMESLWIKCRNLVSSSSFRLPEGQ
jgi:hypothetical protein